MVSVTLASFAAGESNALTIAFAILTALVMLFAPKLTSQVVAVPFRLHEYRDDHRFGQKKQTYPVEGT